MKKLLRSCFYLFLPITLGGIMGFFIKDFIDFDVLSKPSFTPPSILFPIVWSLLYLVMGISFFLYKKDYKEVSEVDIYYYLQLFFNITWPILFFIFKMRFFSILWIFVLFGFIVLLVKFIYPKKRISAYLLFPYLLWTIFATYLNIGFFVLN